MVEVPIAWRAIRQPRDRRRMWFIVKIAISFAMRCLSCRYDLSHLTEQRCPECGRAFDPSDPATFESEATKQTIRSWAAGLVIVAIVSNAMSFASGMSEGGAGWAYAFPCLLANGVLIPVVALGAGVLASVQLVHMRGRDAIAWIVMFIAAVSGIAAVWMLLHAIEAVASV